MLTDETTLRTIERIGAYVMLICYGCKCIVASNNSAGHKITIKNKIREYHVRTIQKDLRKIYAYLKH